MPQKPDADSQKSSPNNCKLILIGEDDLDDQEFLQEVFLSIDPSLSFHFTTNGTQALGYLTELKNSDVLPSLIILDYNMPGLNGADILKELKNNARFAHVPKIIWSTSQSDTYKTICLDLGANDYVVKPSNVKDLVEVAKRMLSFCKS